MIFKGKSLKALPLIASTLFVIAVQRFSLSCPWHFVGLSSLQAWLAVPAQPLKSCMAFLNSPPSASLLPLEMRERRMLQPLELPEKSCSTLLLEAEGKSLKKHHQAELNFFWSWLLLEQYNMSPGSKYVYRGICKACHWAKVLQWAKVMKSVRNSMVLCDRDCGFWIQINAGFRRLQAVWNETNLRDRTKMFYLTPYKFRRGRKDRELLSFTGGTSSKK